MWFSCKVGVSEKKRGPADDGQAQISGQRFRRKAKNFTWTQTACSTFLVAESGAKDSDANNFFSHGPALSRPTTCSSRGQTVWSVGFIRFDSIRFDSVLCAHGGRHVARSLAVLYLGARDVKSMVNP